MRNTYVNAENFYDEYLAFLDTYSLIFQRFC